MASNRIGRINEEIQRELSELIRTLKDPRVQTMISITQVHTTPDLRYSKIYVSVYDEQRGKIVCFYQSEVEDTKAIVKFLSDKLPKYMWPNIYKRYDKLPMNKNSKIDRVKLKEEIGRK